MPKMANTTATRPPTREVSASATTPERSAASKAQPALRLAPQDAKPPLRVHRGDDLEALAVQINSAHEAGEEAARKGLEHYRAAGQALLKARAQHGHGRWLDWLKAHCPKIQQQRASEYMRLAEGWGKLPPSGSLSLKEALRLIDGPKAKKAKNPKSTIPDIGSRMLPIDPLPEEVADEIDDKLRDLMEALGTDCLTSAVVEAIRFTHKEKCHAG